MKQDSNLRSVAKTLSWRFLATTATAILVIIFTGNWRVAFVIGGSEAIAKMVLYFFHERIWNQVPWGKISIPPKIIAVIENKNSKGGSIVPALRRVLYQLQRPTVMLDGEHFETVPSQLMRKWVEEVSTYSIYPIFVFQDWDPMRKAFLDQFDRDVYIINRAAQQVGKDSSFRVWEHDGTIPLNKRTLQAQFGSL